MSKIVLTNVGNIQDTTTAAAVINTNASVIQNAFDNTISRDGTSPNQMSAPLDMNSQQIINLPNPATANSPARLADLNTLKAGGTITNIPGGGNAGQVLSKNSSSNYDVIWANSVTSVGLSLPADLTVTGSPVTSTGTLTGAWATPPTGTGGVVRATSPTLVTPNIGQATATSVNGLVITPAAGTLTIPAAATLAVSGNFATTLTSTGATNSILPNGTHTLVGQDTTDTLTNKTFNTAATGNLFYINGVLVTDNTGTGLIARQTSPTLTTPNIVGVTAGTDAAAGSVGEYIQSTLTYVNRLAALTSGVAVNVTSISLTAGDWDIAATAYLETTGTPTGNAFNNFSISATSATSSNIDGEYIYGTPNLTTATDIANVVGPVRRSISGTTIFYLVVNCNFTGGTFRPWGQIRARRMR